MKRPQGLTKAQWEEAQWRACLKDKFYFAENFYYIPVVGVGAQLLTMCPCQRLTWHKIDENDKTIGLKARQIGWTTATMCYAFQDAWFNVEHPWLLVSRNEDASIKMLNKAIYAYDRLPKWMKQRGPQIVSRTQQSLVFSNGSRIESVPATGSTGRGDAVYGSFMDEAAFMEYAEGIWGAVEPLTYGKIIVVSTANGMGNFFHETWLESQRPDSSWEGIFFPWSESPDRDMGWYETQRLAYRGREWLFYQEYPSTPEEAFAKSGRRAFDDDLLNKQDFEEEPVLRLKYTIGGIVEELLPSENADIEVVIWEEPTIEMSEDGQLLRAPNYVVACDVAEGLEHGDLTTVAVYNANTGEQVAASRSSIPVAYLDEFLEWFGYYYKTALMIPERNNAGIMPCELLANTRYYPRMYRMDEFAVIPVMDRTIQYGWKTTMRSKPKMVLDFQRALGDGLIKIRDPWFKYESQTFVSDGKGGYGATSTNHDDVIMVNLIAWQGVLDVPKYPVIWRDTAIRPVTHADVDNMIFHETTDDPMERPIGQGESWAPKKALRIGGLRHTM